MSRNWALFILAAAGSLPGRTSWAAVLRAAGPSYRPPVVAGPLGFLGASRSSLPGSAGLAPNLGSTALPSPILPGIGGPGRAGFFFNQHDAYETYRSELKDFVAGHDEILVESLPNGPPRRIYQAVADGKMTPAKAMATLSGLPPMERVVLDALFDTGKKVLVEPVFQSKHRADRRRIDGVLVPRASRSLSKALSAFTEEGDASEAAKWVRRYTADMGRIHALRENILAEDLTRRLSRKKGGGVGVIFGTFHTRPYHKLKERGFPVTRSFHPDSRDGESRTIVYNRPLKRFVSRRPRLSERDENREALSFVLFYGFLDKRFRIDRFADRQVAIYNAIAERLSWRAWEALTEDASRYAAGLEDPEDHDRIAGYLLRWLSRNGLITPEEKRAFRYR